MTRRITFLVGVTCAVLLFALLTGCGADEVASPPRTIPATSAPPGSSGTPADESDDRELCDVATEAAADAASALREQPLFDVMFEFFARIEPHTDGQLRDDIELVVSESRSSLDGEPSTSARDAAVVEANARIVSEIQRRCGALVLPGAA